MKNKFISVAAFFGSTAVVLGAFGAHYLKEKLEPSSLESFKTAVFYQFIHTVVILLLATNIADHKWIQRSMVLFTIGVLCFSGSIYFLSTQALHHLYVKFLGPVTPLGGLFFIMGWLYILAYSLLGKGRSQ